MDFGRIGAVGLQNEKAPPPMPIDRTKMRCLTERQWNVQTGGDPPTPQGMPRSHRAYDTPLRADFANLFRG